MGRRAWTGPLRRRLRQDPREVDFGRRRFRLRGGTARERLEDSGRAFLEGYNEAVAGSGDDHLAEALAQVPGELRGFAAEGAAMGCALLDLLTLSRGRRFRALLDGPAEDFPHPVHVGAGRAFARLHLQPWHLLRAGDPLLRWAALDGYGFHQGFLDADRAVGRQAVESGLGGARRAVRDQGLGRALWFHECADPEAVALRIAEFPVGRRADLWAGVGSAATYAGGCDAGELADLAAASAGHRAHLAQGSAFAAAAHVRSGLAVPAHCVTAAKVLTGASPEAAAGWTDNARAALNPAGAGVVSPRDGDIDRAAATARAAAADDFGGSASAPDRSACDVAAYQAWRAGIRRQWFEHTTRLTPWRPPVTSAVSVGRSAGSAVSAAPAAPAAPEVDPATIIKPYVERPAVPAQEAVPGSVRADPDARSLLCP